jgi:hypothetical protein
MQNYCDNALQSQYKLAEGEMLKEKGSYASA